MGLGYKAQPQGLAAIVARFKETDRKLDAVRRQALSPLSAAVGTNSSDGLNPSADFTTVVEVHTQTPSGFSRGLVHATGSAGCTTTSAGGTSVGAAVLLQNQAGATRIATLAAAQAGGVGCSHARLVEGLSAGDDVGVAVVAFEGSPGNVAAASVAGELSISVTWLR